MKRLLLVVAVLCVSVSAHAQDSPGKGLELATVVFSTTAAADWITTHRSLSTFRDCDRANLVSYCAGASRERNPFLSSLDSPTKIVVTGAVMDAAGIFIAHKFGKKHPKLVKAILYGASAYRGFLAVRNEVTLQRSQNRAVALNAIYGAR